MADKFVDKQTGEEVLKSPVTSSAGAGDAGKIPALNGSGTLDPSFFPTGTVDRITANVSEDIDGTTTPQLVNVWNDSGTTKVRKADATDNSKPADGIVITAATTGNPITVIPFKGRITGFTGLTQDTIYYLSTTPGGITSTPPSSSGNVMQPVGFTEGTSVLVMDVHRTRRTEIA